MAKEDTQQPEPDYDDTQPDNADDDPFDDRHPDSDYNSDSDYPPGYDTPSDIEEEAKMVMEGRSPAYQTRPGEQNPPPPKSPEQIVLEMYREKLEREDRRRQVLEREFLAMPDDEEQFDFPEDKEKWREEDLKELWMDGPVFAEDPGWDPVMADEEDWEEMEEEMEEKGFPLASFYVPYRRPYPLVPDIEPPRPSGYEEKRFRLFKQWHHDIQTPKDVVHELSRIEFFLDWVSYVFPDGSSYEGTIWDDLAHGKGVFVADHGLLRYEGEWMRNQFEGHGVIEVDIPDAEPLPGSKLEARMRAEGKIFKRDYMDPEDKKWLEMDMEDSAELTNGRYVTPLYDSKDWVKQFGKKPEKGRYRYAGQWKHGRMHGCGLYEVNEKMIYGRFYFGEFLDEPWGCDDRTSALHAGIADVAAAKARMFVNKPDGMVREQRGPYSDPQHPYLYEEEDVWQAPGFINQFYEVPDYWKTYVREVDGERELWLNSFYKAPLRLPMPAELEHWWETEEEPEFVLVNKEPEPDPEDPSKLIYTEDPLILHTKTGRLINYIEDEEHGIRLFWQPPAVNGEVDVSKVEFLPLGFDELEETSVYAEEDEKEEEKIKEMEKRPSKLAQRLLSWAEKQIKEGKMRKELLEKEMELVEAELSLEEAIEDFEEAKIEGKEAIMDEVDDDTVPQQEEVEVPGSAAPEEKTSPKMSGKVEEVAEEEEEDEDDFVPSSFGVVSGDADTSKDEGKSSGSRKSPFSTLSFASYAVLSTLPSKVHQSFLSWKNKAAFPQKTQGSLLREASTPPSETSCCVSFQISHPNNTRLRAHVEQQHLRGNQHLHYPRRKTVLRAASGSDSWHTIPHRKEPESGNPDYWLRVSPETYSDCILSLQIPVRRLDKKVDDVER